ncbi:RNA-directed DNA polymerase, eukaryota, reverse transcriptase zinc-binding domain protein [Tanacetum coccineum]
MERGIRQGDPLSPFLFLLVAEALQVFILEACTKGVFTGLFLDNDGSNISLLQYADDALFFGEWSYSNASNLIRILGYFQDASGLCINLSKSRFYGIGENGNEDSVMKIMLCGKRLLKRYVGHMEGLNKTSTLICVMEFGKVSDHWCLENGEWHGNWVWRSNPRGRAAADLVNLLRLVGSKSIGLGESNQNFIWNTWVPRKVNISIWRASMDRLPSRANLLNRGVEIECARCVLCDMENKVKTVKHCTSIRDISLIKGASIENKWVAKCFHEVCYVMLWAIWHWRNRILHASPHDVDSVRQEDIFPSIQRLSLIWISNICSRTNRQWCGWVSNPRGAESG